MDHKFLELRGRILTPYNKTPEEMLEFPFLVSIVGSYRRGVFFQTSLLASLLFELSDVGYRGYFFFTRDPFVEGDQTLPQGWSTDAVRTVLEKSIPLIWNEYSLDISDFGYQTFLWMLNHNSFSAGDPQNPVTDTREVSEMGEKMRSLLEQEGVIRTEDVQTSHADLLIKRIQRDTYRVRH